MRDFFRDLFLFKWILLGFLLILLVPSLGIWYLAEYYGQPWTTVMRVIDYLTYALLLCIAISYVRRSWLGSRNRHYPKI